MRISRFFLFVLLALILSALFSISGVPSAEASPWLPLPPARSTVDQSPPTSNDPLRFDGISIEQGLSQSAVLTIAQDAQGYMWFGTEGGLNRYDGYQFTIYRNDAENPQTLMDDYVSSIRPDRDGTLWIGTRSGLEHFNPTTGVFVHYRQNPNDDRTLGGNWVAALLQDKNGMLWAGTDDGGLSRLDPATGVFTRYRHDAAVEGSLSSNSVRALYQDKDGALWVGTGGGLDRFDPASSTFTHFLHDDQVATSLSSNQVSAIFQDQQGWLWVGTENAGLNRLDLTTGQFTRYWHNPDNPASLSHDRVRAILQDRSGRLWVGTQNGLDQFDRQTNALIHFHHDPANPHSLTADTIWSLYEDAAGVLWVGTYSGGVNKFSDLNNRFTSYSHNPYVDSISDNMIWSLMEDRERMLWIGTFNGGLNRLDRATGAYTYYRHNPADADSLSSDDVRAIALDAEGNLWIGTSAGLDRFEPTTQRFIHYRNDPNDPQSLSDNRVNVLLVDRRGTLWAGTRGGGLNRYDPATSKFVRYRNAAGDETSLGDDRVWALYEDRAGRIWVGTLGGINVLNPANGKFEHYRNDPSNSSSLSNNSAFSFYEDPAGSMWIGTWGSGLDRFNPATQTFTHYTVKQGLPDNVIYSIEPDRQGFMWMSTNHGIARFDPRTEKFRNFDVRDGLQSNEFNAGAHALTAAGEILFGGVNGFSSFYPERIQSNTHVPPIVITQFSKFNKSDRLNLSDGQTVGLGFNDNFVSFDFAALDFTAPDKNQYAYKMDGLDKDWVEAGARRHADYPNLPPGQYVFRVRASNNDGVWNEQGIAVAINVEPPLWETWWFRGAALLLAAGLVLGLYEWRVQSIHARSRELERLVIVRTGEIERHTSQLEALYRADQELHRHLGLDQVLQSLVDVAVDLLHADKSVIFLWDEGAKRFAARITRGVAPQTAARLVVARGEGTIGQVTEKDEPIIVSDLRIDPRRRGERADLLEAIEGEGVRAYMNLPLEIRGQVFGIFGVAFTQPHDFDAAEQKLYIALAQRAALAIENAQLYERSQHAAALEERNRLARELHDAVTQTLFSANMIADTLPKVWEKNPERARALLQDLRQLSRGALAEMRTLLLELRPASLEKARLADLLAQLGDAFTGRTGIPVQVDVAGECAPPPTVQVALYRIAQEALNNIAKHAHATKVSVCVRRAAPNGSGEAFELIVNDDGRGFDPAQVPAGHFGLGILRERSEAIGAQLNIDSRPGAGTQVLVRWSPTPVLPG